MKKFLSVTLAVLAIFMFAAPCVAAAQQTQVNYLLLGDSIAAGLGIENPDKGSYGAIAAYSNGYNYKNDAVSGYTSFALVNRIEINKNVREDISQADIISLSIGGNDFLLDNMLKLIVKAYFFDDYSDFEEIADAYYNNLQKIFDLIKELNPDVAILLQNLYNPRFDGLREIYQNGINILNSRIEKFASETASVYLVDVASYTANLGSEYFQNDQTHPNAQGHEVIAQAVVDTLYDLGLGTAQTATAQEPGVTRIGLIKRIKKLIAEFISAIKTIIEK